MNGIIKILHFTSDCYENIYFYDSPHTEEVDKLKFYTYFGAAKKSNGFKLLQYLGIYLCSECCAYMIEEHNV